VPVRSPFHLFYLCKDQRLVIIGILGDLVKGVFVEVEMIPKLFDKAVIILNVEQENHKLEADDVGVVPHLFFARLGQHVTALFQTIVSLLNMLDGCLKISLGKLRINTDFETISHIFGLLLVDELSLFLLRVPLLVCIIRVALFENLFHDVFWVVA
jgi:hypothetical protein